MPLETRTDDSQQQQPSKPLPTFSGAPCSQVLCIELCAGCARLSSALKRLGFATVAVDHSKNRYRSLHPTVFIDLANEESVQQVVSLFDQQGVLLYLHAAPPCCTISRARNRRISKTLQARGIPDPRPLRSDKHPNGLPRLRGVDAKELQLLMPYIATLLSFWNMLGIIQSSSPLRTLPDPICG